MNSAPLFRPEAVAARRQDALGRVVLVGSVSIRTLIAVFTIIAAALGCLACFGTYTDHRTLRGRLVTERSVIDVRSPQLGLVAQRRVVEGQVVQRGEVMYVISSERVSSDGGATQRLVGEQLEQRRRSLAVQIVKTRELAQLERRSLDDSTSKLMVEMAKVRETTASQVVRSDLAREAADRYERIRTAGFVSDEQLHGKRAELLEQRGRQLVLEREESALARQLAEIDGRSAASAVRFDNEVAELERSVAETDLQIAENEARRAVVVSAPDAGVVTGIVLDVGDPVDSATSLAFIVPVDSKLQAELYAPSRAAGFLAVGQEVLLRYEPYPYQKFGHYRGRVRVLSQAAFAPGMLRAVDADAVRLGEPTYQVIVALDQQTVMAYGEPRALRPGMAVEADVLLETRRLYEWVFEPIYSLVGKNRR